ncbi:MFS general substrate transporter [Phellopilus nigrolimitatus]|nr:MFS general substrate transporter [Phellopilus nigrolimitatus]
MSTELRADDHDERSSLLRGRDSKTKNILASDEEQLLTSPLLPSSLVSSTATLCAQETPSPLPWRPVAVILVLNAVQPLAFELVFPFINQMILETGIVEDPQRVGFYSGVIESIFALMSFLFIVPCSFMSDRYGRKPVVLISIGVLSVSTALFGFSRSYWFMIVTRSAGGISGASWSTMKVMLGEITDRSNQGKTFAAFGIAYRIGQILGQPVGGLLSHPERNFPLFGGSFWKAYPYAFPCLFSASFAALATIAGCFTLKETKPKKIQKVEDYGAASGDGIQMKSKKQSAWRAVLTPHVISVISSLSTMVIASEMLFALYPLFAFTPIESGGLGLSEAAIGAHMAVRSFISIVLMFAFSPLQSRLGTMRTYRYAMLFWPFNIAFFPILNVLARWGVCKYILNAVLCLFFLVWGIANISWPASAVMINDAAPSADTLAAMNGISQMAIVLPQTIAPAFVTSVFAFSVSSNILGGNLIWIVLLCISCIASVHSLTLKEPTHDWREDYKSQVSETS